MQSNDNSTVNIRAVLQTCIGVLHMCADFSVLYDKVAMSAASCSGQMPKLSMSDMPICPCTHFVNETKVKV